MSSVGWAKENGSPIHPHSFSQTFERLFRRAGVRTIRVYDLRHTQATLALKAGVPVKVVSERLGHESPAFTLKQYAHVIRGMQTAAAAGFAELIKTDAPAREAAPAESTRAPNEAGSSSAATPRRRSGRPRTAPQASVSAAAR